MKKLASLFALLAAILSACGGGDNPGVEAASKIAAPVNTTPKIKILSVSADSSITLQDAIAVLKMIVGLEVNPDGAPITANQAFAADYDGNGKVELADAIGILKQIVGLSPGDPKWVILDPQDPGLQARANLNPGSAPVLPSATTPTLVAVLRGDVLGSPARTVSYADGLILSQGTAGSNVIPSINLTASAASVLQGDSVTLTWSSTHAISCSAGGAWSGALATQGSQAVPVLALGSSEFTLTCVNGLAAAVVSVSMSSTVKPYFLEQPNAFPGAAAWFNWTDPNNDPPVVAGVNKALAIDMNGDGVQDLVLFMSKTYTGIDTELPARTRVAVLSLNAQRQFVDITSSVIQGPNSFAGLIAHPPVIGDLNGDGKPDIVFAFDQDDGRKNLVKTGQLGALISNASGGYSSHSFNQSGYWQDAAIGYDSKGKGFVLGMGSMFNLLYMSNYTYQFVNGEFSIVENLAPAIDPMRGIFLSSAGTKSSDRLIAINQSRFTQLDGYLKDADGQWQLAGQLSAYRYPKVGNVRISNGSGYSNIEVHSKNGKYVWGEGAGNDGGSMCEIQLSPGSEKFVLMSVSENTFDNFSEGATITMADVTQTMDWVGVKFQNGSLVYQDINFNNIPKGVINANQLECIDVNNDGYTDVVINKNLIGGVDNLAPLIFINNKDGTFSASKYSDSLSILPTHMTSPTPISSTLIGDFDGDGMQDIIMFLSNPAPVVNGAPTLDGTFKFFRGLKNLAN